MQAFAEKSRKREEIKEEGGREGRERKNRVKEAGVEEEGRKRKEESRRLRDCRRHCPAATDTSRVSGFLNNFSGERETVAKNI